MSMTSDLKEILSTQSESKTLPEWVDFFNNKYTKKQIADFCSKHKYKYKHLSKDELSKIQSNNARKYHINQDYFKTWTHNMAYIFGLWCADGCIYRGKMFDITLHSKDKYILNKVKNELGYEGNIYDGVDRQAARINFSCVTIYNDLVSLGGEECKSSSITFPEVPDEFLHDFIRGFFDGDGSVWNVKNKRINSGFTCASKVFIDKLWEILKEKAEIVGGSYDASSYTLRFGKKDSILLGKFLYKDDPELFLKRKRDKFTPYLT